MTKPSGVISGRIADRPVADLFESIHSAKKTGVARFRTALGSATVWFRDGELIDADMGRFHMDAAILRLLKIRDGEFEVELKQVSRRRVIKPSTAQLLAEGRQRAPRPGRPSGEAIRASSNRRDSISVSGAVSSPPAANPVRTKTPSGPRRPLGPSDGDDAQTRVVDLSDSANERRPRPFDPRTERPTRTRTPASVRSASEDNMETVVAVKPAAPTSEAGGRRGRRKPAGWQPMAGGTGQKPPPSGTAEPPASEPKGKRTMFMFGVSGQAPASPDELTPSAVPAPRAPSIPTPAASPGPRSTTAPAARAARRAAQPAAPAATPPAAARARGSSPATPVAAPASRPATPPASPPAGAITTPAPTEDSGKLRRRRAARAQASPFEPERVDRTLMRAGPIPPPPGEAVGAGTPRPPSGPNRTVPMTNSGAIPVQAVARGATPIPSTQATMAPPGSMPSLAEPVRAPRAPAPTLDAAPSAIIDEEYSHPISVPNAAPYTGPGGTMMLGKVPPVEAPPEAKPLPADPQAEPTVVIRADAIVDPRAHNQSGPGKSAHVGRYEVLLRLARGGMGTVYLCRVTGEGGFRRLFALKVVREHLNQNATYVQMLLEEARIASRLSHPNVVGIVDIDTFANQHFVVMEYVEGCTFSELLKAHPRARPPERIIPIVIDSLTGLHAAHTMRADDGSVYPLVHCDFSPHNMLVGVNGTCRITDFGVSKAADALPDSRGRGKPGYLSPEQVRGLALDARSDIFSAGVVLWNALTGDQLFDGDSPEEIVHQVVTRKIPKPSTVGLRPPACFDRICLKALERDPNRRYQSAERMMMELRKVAIAEDYLAPSSEVGQWVQESFGAQIELRRQAAGLAPSHLSTALALRDVGPSGHAEAVPGEGSATGRDSNASQTMMIQGQAIAGADADEGLG
nr:protein kinase [Deltaproteobacteria bacterium]